MIYKLLKILLVPFVSFIVLFSTFSIPKKVYTHSEQEINCGLPLPFVRMEFTNLQPPYPFTVGCSGLSPFESIVTIAWENLIFSSLIIFMFVGFIAISADSFGKTYRKSNKYFATSLIIIFLISLGFTILISYEIDKDNNVFTQEEAVTLVKKYYPSFEDYPSDNLPPKSIKTEKTGNGWYIQFRQEGSGFPTIEAHCFLVKYLNEEQQIQKTGEYRNDLDGFKDSVTINNCI